MISLKMLCSILAIALTLLGSSSYLFGVLNGRSKPHAVSWFVWAVVMFVAFLGQRKEGSGWGALPTLIGAIQTAGIFFLALRGQDQSERALSKISKADWLCLALAVLCFALYFGSEVVLYSMLLATFIDFLGYIPTFFKTLKDPSGEELRPWLCYSIAVIFGILAIERYSFTTLVYPGTMLVLNWLLVVVIVFHPKSRHGAPG